LLDASPVESVPYSLFQNIVALAAVALVIIRVIILLTQLQNEDFSTRTVVKPCEMVTPSYGRTMLVVSSLFESKRLSLRQLHCNDGQGHSEDRGSDAPRGETTAAYSHSVQLLVGDNTPNMTQGGM
jgi:hypothetical protein